MRRPAGWACGALAGLAVAAVFAPTPLTGARAGTWRPQVSGVTARLRGVSAVSDRVAWASGSGNTVLRTTDGGESWTRVAPPSPDRLDFRDVDAVSADEAYVLSIGNGALSRIFKTVDAGRTWIEQFRAADDRVFLDAMAFWDARRGVVVGDSIGDAFYVLLTDDGGSTWRPVPAAAMPAALANEGYFAASGTNVTVRGNHIWAGTGAASRARVLHSADRGRTWRVVDTPLAAGPSAGIYSIAFRDDRHGVVVGGDYAREAEAVRNAAVTEDGGRTWTLVGARGLSGFRSAVSPVPGARRAWLAVGPLGSDVSTDDGATWARVEGPGFDTFSVAPGRGLGWGAGARGAIGRWQADR
jgi:photosystem II stability/assembly factor-like uncharacterized protein